jgi:hypothetical protein
MKKFIVTGFSALAASALSANATTNSVNVVGFVNQAFVRAAAN